MKKILLTGSNGFLASKLLKKLIQKNYKVLSLDKYNNINKINNKNFSFFRIDLTKTKELEKIKNREINTLIHAAAIQPSSKIKDYKKYYNINVLSTFNLIQALGVKIRKIIYCSSFSVYNTDKSAKNIKETSSLKARNFYGLTKKISEDLLIHFSEIFGYQLIILRFDGIFGKNQNLPGFIDFCKKRADQNKSIEIFNMRKNKRDNVYIDDCIQAVIKCLKYNHKKYNIFNIAGGHPTTQKKMVEHIKKITNSRSNIILSRKKNKNFFGDVYLNISKAKKILKYKPKSLFNNLNDFLRK